MNLLFGDKEELAKAGLAAGNYIRDNAGAVDKIYTACFGGTL